MTQNKEHLTYENSENDADIINEKRIVGSNEPLRLGRRESEPHSAEVTYLFDVLSSNFPNHRTIWDLHHYFLLGGVRVDVQFDLSFFMDFNVPEDLPSYDSTEYNNKIPDLVINVLSKSTWEKDLSKIQEICRKLKIPIYIVFLSYPIAPTIFTIPFLRVYELEKDGNYRAHDLTSFMYDLDKLVDSTAKFLLSDKYPFDIALQKLSRTYLGSKTRTRMILVKKGTEEIYLGKEKQRADEEKQRADEEKQRADKEKQRADEEKLKADKEKQRADEAIQDVTKEKQRADEAELKIKKLE